MKKSKDLIQNEALEALKPHRRAGVGISMGVGKTLIGLRHMALHYSDYAAFLVVIPKNSIKKTWLDDADKFGLSHLKSHIVFTTYLSLHKQQHDYDVVYFDECQSLKYNHRSWIDQYLGKIVGLTGTPPKFKKSEKGEMVNAYCPIVYEYKTDEAIEDDILNDYEINVHKLQLSNYKNIPVVKGDKMWYTSEQATYDYWCKRIMDASGAKQLQISRIMRMKAMMEFPSKEAYAKKLLESINNKCIIFANTQEQADRLCQNRYHSNNPSSEEALAAFKEGSITKLSCVLQLSEGVNIPNLRESVILHAYGNERKTAQRIGRTLRLNPNEKATIHILCFEGTADEKWVIDSLENFDQTKINWL